VDLNFHREKVTLKPTSRMAKNSHRVSHPHASGQQGANDEVGRAAEIGADIATVPFAVLKQTLHHPLTDLGLERFLADWRKTNQKI